MRNRGKILYPLAGVAAFLFLWQVLAAGLIRRAWLLPTPAAVVRSLVDNAGLLLYHSGFTIKEALVGLVLSVALSLLLAWLMNLSRPLRQALYPLLLGSQMVPIIVLAPLFLIWFGYGLLPKVLVVILICFFPMVINILAGLNAAGPATLAFYRAMGMNRRQLFRKVQLPWALPYFFGGLRVSATYSVMGAVIGEWLGAEAGLGLLLTRAQSSFDLPLAFAAIFAIILWSALLLTPVAICEHRLLKWQRKENEEDWK